MNRRIAIVGVGLRMPGSRSLPEFFENTLRKKCFIREVPEWLWDQSTFFSEDNEEELVSYSKLAALLEEEDEDFDFLKVPPSTLKTMSQPQLLGLLCAREALEDANLLEHPTLRETTGVIVAATAGCDVAEAQSETFFAQQVFRRLEGLTQSGADRELLLSLKARYLEEFPSYPVTAESLPGRSTHLVAGRIAWAFDLHGPNITIDAACASSLAAIDCSVNALRSGECDVVLTGGVDTWMTADAFVLFSKVTALGREGSFPFDKRANGFILGEGCGMVVLKRLDDALRDGDRIYATIDGVGTSSDGAGAGITAPQTPGQLRALERAYADAAKDPGATVYVECHGTGTGLGDPTELRSLDTFFSANRSQGPLKIGSAKASVGHLRTAAGMAGLFAALLPLNTGWLPPQVNFEDPTEALEEAEGRLQVVTRPEFVNQTCQQTAVSGFGFGGTNFHLVLSKADQAVRPLVLNPERHALNSIPTLKNETAFLFPGQGSQYSGMFNELLKHPEVAHLFTTAQSIVFEEAGLSLTDALEAESEALKNTVLAQPAILTVSFALYQLLRLQGFTASLFVGHSLGEYTALCAAGCLTFEDAVRAVTRRGLVMAQTTDHRESTLLCLIGPAHKARQVLEQFGSVLEPANFNSYDQTVVAAEVQYIDQITRFAEERGLQTSQLKVDRGFHSSFVSHAVSPMREHLASLDLKLPKVPIPANAERGFYPFATGERAVPTDEEKQRIVNLLAIQISEPVDFVSQVELAYEAGIRRFIEIGPRRVLSGLVRSLVQGKKAQVLSLDLAGQTAHQRPAKLKSELAQDVPFQRQPPARCRPRNVHMSKTDEPFDLRGLSTEEKVREVVAAVSGYSKDKLSSEAEFEGELGLDSLKMVQIISRLRGVVLPKEHRGFRGLNSIQKIVDLAGQCQVETEAQDRPVRCFLLKRTRFEPERFDGSPTGWIVTSWDQNPVELEVGKGTNRLFVGPLPDQDTLCTALIKDILQAIKDQQETSPGSRLAVITYESRSKGSFNVQPALAAFLRSAMKDVPDITFSYHHLNQTHPSDPALRKILDLKGLGVITDTDGRSWLDVHTEFPKPDPCDALFCSDDLLLVTGGARGIASRVVRSLLQNSDCRFLLLGRRSEGPDWLSQSEAARVEYLQCDLSEPRCIEGLNLEKYPVTYLIHSAGVGSMCPLLQRASGDMDVVFGAKVHGLKALYARLDSTALKGVICFSSIAAYFGTPAQADYSAANALLDGFSPGNVPVLSLQWTAWGDVGMAVRDGAKEIVETTGLEYISSDEASHLFRRLCCWWNRTPRGPGSQTVVAVVKNLPSSILDGAPPLVLEETQEKLVALSAAQKGIYFLESAYNLKSAHHVAWSDLIEGEIDLERMEESFQLLLDNNDALRTSFVVVEGEVSGRVFPSVGADFAYSEFNPAARLEDVIRAYQQEPFQLGSPPLIRARVIRLEPKKHLLLVVIHHIVVDGVSTHLIRRQIFGRYRGTFGDGKSDVKSYYARPAAREKSRLLSVWRESLGDHWKRPLFPRASRESFSSKNHYFDIVDSQFQTLFETARRATVTPFSLFCSALGLVLSQRLKRPRIVVGVPLEGRTQETGDIVGLFVNTMPVVMDFSNPRSHQELLEITKSLILAALENQDLSFPELVEEIRPPGVLGQHPLFQVVVEYQQVQSDGVDIPVLSQKFVSHHPQEQYYDLLLSVLKCADICYCRIQYRLEVLKPEQVSAIAGQIQDTLTRFSKLDSQVALAWTTGNLWQAFQSVARRVPEQKAVVEKKAALSYSELIRQAESLAAVFKRQGLKPSDRVVIDLPRRSETVIHILAALACQAIVVPLEHSDPLKRKQVLTTLVEANWTLRSAEETDEWTPELRSLEGPGVAYDPSIAFIMFTSGSTGHPKAVLVTHDNIINLVGSLDALGWGSGKRVLHASSLAFDASFLEIWGSLLSGATLVVHSEETPTLSGLKQNVQREAVSAAWFTAALLNLIVDEEPELLSQFEQVLTGGETLSPNHLARALQAAPATQFFNGYGPTECTTFATLHPIVEKDTLGPIPIGRPLSHVSCKLIDSQGQSVEPGEVGELLVGGAGVCDGYLNSDPNDLAFYHDAELGRAYRTGDLVRYRDDGILEFLGRKDRQLKIRGFRVEPAEIERHLVASGLVKRCAVGGISNGRSTELTAFLVPKTVGLSPDQVHQSLKSAIPSFMLPSRVTILDELPTNTSGKVDWGQLEANAIEQPFSQGYSVILPRDPLEELVAKVWEDALKVRPIGVKDDFTALGGHSLLALQIFDRIEKLLGKKMPLTTLYYAPTVEKLTARIKEEGWETSWRTVVPMKTGGNKPRFFCVHGAGGDVYGYRHLAGSLKPNYNFVGLQARGLDGKEEPHQTVEQMAEFYFRKLREHQPEGPYCLGGFSSGGAVAFHLACLLRKAGLEVSFLALIDTFYPLGSYSSKERVIDDIAQTLRDVKRVSTDALQYSRKVVTAKESVDLEAVQRVARQARKVLLGRLGLAQRHFYDTDSHTLADSKPTLVQLSLRALDQYRAPAYDGNTVLFHSRNNEFEGDFDGRLAWERVCKAGVKVVSLPGDHLTVLERPHCEQLARELERLLDQVAEGVKK